MSVGLPSITLAGILQFPMLFANDSVPAWISQAWTIQNGLIALPGAAIIGWGVARELRYQIDGRRVGRAANCDSVGRPSRSPHP
jgi:hypothetical protein